MKSHFTVSLAILAGVGIGAVAVQSLHAQNKPPVYFVAETDVSNPDAYAKECAEIGVWACRKFRFRWQKSRPTQQIID
jgi:hypothetical protein